MGHSNRVLLHSSTLRWFENLKFIFSGASRSKSINTQEVSAGLTFQADRSQCFLASISGQVSRAACCSTSAASGSRPPAARPQAGPATQSRPRPQLPQHARQRPRRVILLLHGEGHLHEDGEMGNEGAEKPTHKLAIHGAREAWI